MSAKFEEIKIPVPWGHVAAKWWGPQNRQPIIAIHGWYDNAGSFDTLAPLMVNKGLSVLCIDLPGHGFSSWYPPGMPYTTWNYVIVLRRIVLHYGWQKITLLAHSLGGSISFIYSSSYPNEVKKYIIFDIAAPIVKNPVYDLDKLGLRIDNFLKTETPSRSGWHKYEEMISLIDQIYQGSLTRKSCEILLKRGTKSESGERYKVSVDDRLKFITFGPLSLEHIHVLGDKIICDVMYVRAKQGVPFDKPAEYYDGVIEKLTKPKVKKSYYIEGSHHLHLNNPEAVINQIMDFLKPSN